MNKKIREKVIKMEIRKKGTGNRRRLESQANNNGIEKTWHSFCGKDVVTVVSNLRLSIDRIASEASLDGKMPQLIVLTNIDEDFYTIVSDREEKLLSELAKKLNSIDKAALHNGSLWSFNNEKNTLRSPNHGDTTSLRLGAVVNAIREIHIAEETQAEKVLCEGGVKGIKAYVKTLEPDGFKGKIKEGNGEVIITLA